MSVWDKQHGGSHYQKYKIQPSKFVVENELLYPEGCAIKYIIRHRDKGKEQDLLKAIHFIEMIIERDYPEKKVDSSSERIGEELSDEEWLNGYKKWNLLTIKNIKEGEELTLKYTFYTVKKDFYPKAIDGYSE